MNRGKHNRVEVERRDESVPRSRTADQRKESIVAHMLQRQPEKIGIFVDTNRRVKVSEQSG